MGAKISFSELFTYAVGDSTVHLPLSQLDRSSTTHIHGRLEIEIAGRVVPHMGFFAPSDVCLNTWVEELFRVLHFLGPSTAASYVFDEGEQGQPAFEFKREGEALFVSITESQLSGTSGDPSFQRVSCLWSEFRSETEQFLEALRSAIVAESPRVGASWWSEHALRPA
jgi:hypothetical protein